MALGIFLLGCEFFAANTDNTRNGLGLYESCLDRYGIVGT